MKASAKSVGFGRRSLAWLLDLMLLAALWSPFLYMMNIFAAGLDRPSTAWLIYTITRNLLVIAVSTFVLGWTTAHIGGTPGKQLLEIQVIKSGTGNRRLSLQEALLRILLTLASIFTLVGILMLFFDEERRTFADWFMHTRVMEEADIADGSVSGSWT